VPRAYVRAKFLPCMRVRCVHVFVHVCASVCGVYPPHARGVQSSSVVRAKSAQAGYSLFSKLAVSELLLEGSRAEIADVAAPDDESRARKSDRMRASVSRLVERNEHRRAIRFRFRLRRAQGSSSRVHVENKITGMLYTRTRCIRCTGNESRL